MSFVVGIEGNVRVPLVSARMTRVPAGAAIDPQALAALGPTFENATLPATVASVLRARGALDLSNPPPLENDDTWFVAVLPEVPGEGRLVLVLEGLATIADVFVGGAHVLASESAFHRHEIDVTELVRGETALAIRFASLDLHLRKKRPRPRWKTRIVEAQALRFVRTPLLGRTTGFCPAVPPVGPFRPIALERRILTVKHARAVPTVMDGDGVLDVMLALALEDHVPVRGARLEVEGADAVPMAIAGDDDLLELTACARVPSVERWWPHTHGDPRRYAARIVLERDDGERTVDLGAIGFRTIVEEPGDGFGLVVNDTTIFARGAVWTTEDVVACHAEPQVLRLALERVRDAGMNLVRIGGTMTYETDAFHALCDELGILVWQELAFANMDYPTDDASFGASVEREARELLGRIGTRASTAVVCGNSEVEQQAAMLGLPRETWRNALFGEVLPAIAAELAPGVPYVPSSPSGGTLPFHVDHGVGHYYGVGAYLRPLADARTSRVRFASECLAFANVPAQRTIDAFLRDLESPVHHPRWKERVPRDRGASWDFEDVRDHYLELLFGVSARTLRYEDRDRYLALSRVTSGEVLARVFAELRRVGSPCRGALVFFLQDFWPGAGFGLVDSFGRPKAAMRLAARSLSPLAVLPIDEGVNGLYAHVVNDRPMPVHGRLRARLLRDGETEVGRGEVALVAPAQGASVVHVDALFHGFVDTTYAYRFGPAGHDAVALELVDDSDAPFARAVHFPLGIARAVEPDLGLVARVVDDGASLVLSTRRLATFVALELEGAEPLDDFVHVLPGEERRIPLRRTQGSIRGSAHPANQRAATRVVVG